MILPGDIATDIKSAFTLLTRFPVGRLPEDIKPDVLARAVWVYPVVGCVVGSITALVFIVAKMLGFTVPLAVVLCLLVLVLVTGALHEDGLADVADGFGGGRTKDRKLEIMRDSRIGTYGVIALILSFGLRGAALIVIGEHGAISSALVLTAVLSRCAMVGALRFLPPARDDGLGVLVARPPDYTIMVAIVFAVLLTVILYSLQVSVLLIGLTCLCVSIVSWISYRQIGGYTGDVLGSVQQVSEIVILLGLSIVVAS